MFNPPIDIPADAARGWRVGNRPAHPRRSAGASAPREVARGRRGGGWRGGPAYRATPGAGARPSPGLSRPAATAPAARAAPQSRPGQPEPPDTLAPPVSTRPGARPRGRVSSRMRLRSAALHRRTRAGLAGPALRRGWRRPEGYRLDGRWGTLARPGSFPTDSAFNF